MTIKVTCDCEEYKKSSWEIFDAQISHAIRTGVKYKGKMWTHCPWCGKPLKECNESEPEQEKYIDMLKARR